MRDDLIKRLRSLIASWRDEAEELHYRGDANESRAVKRCAADLVLELADEFVGVMDEAGRGA